MSRRLKRLRLSQKKQGRCYPALGVFVIPFRRQAAPTDEMRIISRLLREDGDGDEQEIELFSTPQRKCDIESASLLMR